MATCDSCGKHIDDDYAKEWRWCEACREERTSASPALDSTVLPTDANESIAHVAIAQKSNGYATALKTLGIIFVICGVLFFLKAHAGRYGLFAGLPYIIAGLVPGVMCLGFGEIINLLHKINGKLE